MKITSKKILSIFCWLLLLHTNYLLLAQNGTIKGRVYNPINNEPIPFVNVFIQGTSKGSTTDFDGKYTIDNLPPNLYNIQASYIGYTTATISEIEVSNARPATVDITLTPDEEMLETVEIKANSFVKSEESPVSLRSISANEIQRSPGGNRDISRVVQSLPGVASSSSFRNDLIIRGGAPSENKFYINDIEIPVINHFATQGSSGGPVGMINVDFLREVNFYSGAFPVNRGNALSAVFDFRYKEADTEKILSRITMGSSDLGVTLEGPISDKTSFIFSVRRSYLQFIFKAFGLPFLPTYNDFQFNVKTNINDKNQLTILGIGAIDDFALNTSANESDFQRYLLDNLPVNNQWNYTLGVKYTNFREKSYTNVIVSRSHLNNSAFKYQNNDNSSAENLILDFNSDEIENKLRIENITRTNGYKITAGLSYEYATYTNDTYRFLIDNGIPTDVENNTRLGIHKWGIFGQISKRYLSDRLILSAGLRSDANNYSNEMNNMLRQLSPRFSASYAINSNWSINANTGMFYQLPAYTTLGHSVNNEFVNRQNGLSYIRNRQAVAGVSWNSQNNAQITVEGFYKKYDNYPMSLKDSISMANLGGDFGVIGDEAASSISEGRAYGLEVLLQQKLYKGFYGILAYTLSWSEFTDKNGNLVPSTWDTRHIINLVGGKKIKKNWEVGFRFRMNTGSPYTPYNTAASSLTQVWDITGMGLLNYDLLNTERLSLFHAMDIRIDKKWFFEKCNLNLYLDIQNVYNSVNALAPILVLDRDENGNPQLNPNDNDRYLTKLAENNDAAILPSLGIVVEF